MNIKDTLIDLANNLKIGHEVDVGILKNLDGYTIVTIPVDKTLSYYSFSLLLACNGEDAKILLSVYKDWQLMEVANVIRDEKLSLILMDYLIKTIKDDNYMMNKFNSYIDKALDTIDPELLNDELISLLVTTRMNLAIYEYCMQSFLDNMSKSD
jgi:hypothetical protein